MELKRLYGTATWGADRSGFWTFCRTSWNLTGSSAAFAIMLFLIHLNMKRSHISRELEGKTDGSLSKPMAASSSAWTSLQACIQHYGACAMTSNPVGYGSTPSASIPIKPQWNTSVFLRSLILHIWLVRSCNTFFLICFLSNSVPLSLPPFANSLCWYNSVSLL